MNFNLILDPRRRAAKRAALTRKTNLAIKFAKRSKAAHKAWDTRAWNNFLAGK